jgi:hypothetical protein
VLKALEERWVVARKSERRRRARRGIVMVAT